MFKLIFCCFFAITALNAKQSTIEELTTSFVQAFNSHNAKELADLWAVDAMYTGPDGEQVVGREAIFKGYEEAFQESPKINIQFKDLKINYLAPNLVELSAIAITPGDQTRYSAYAVNNGEKWELISFVESEEMNAISRYQELKPLEWLVGSYQDSSPDMNLDIKSQWTKNKTYILRSFTATVPGRDSFEGTQIIGWDPVDKQVRSWTFDSDGGFSSGVWSQVGDQWYIRAEATLPDGRKATLTNIVKKINDASYTWRTTGVMIDGEMQPEVDAVTLNKRQQEVDNEQVR